jgi:hypothetical protein
VSHFDDSLTTLLKWTSGSSKRGLFERVMSAGAEGARQSGFAGMLGGLGGAALGEGHRIAKVVTAPLTGKTMKEANQEYQ